MITIQFRVKPKMMHRCTASPTGMLPVDWVHFKKGDNRAAAESLVRRLNADARGDKPIEGGLHLFEYRIKPNPRT